MNSKPWHALKPFLEPYTMLLLTLLCPKSLSNLGATDARSALAKVPAQCVGLALSLVPFQNTYFLESVRPSSRLSIFRQVSSAYPSNSFTALLPAQCGAAPV